MDNQQYQTTGNTNQQATNEIQQDLEAQLRLFGASVTDGVFNGFAGRGEEIGAHAIGVGAAFASAVEREVRSAFQEVQDTMNGSDTTRAKTQTQYTNDANNGQAQGQNPYGYDVHKMAYDVRKAASESVQRATEQAAKYSWTSRFQKKPSFELEKTASSRYGVGVMQVIFGALFGLTTLLAGVICLIVGAMVGIPVELPTVIVGVALSAVGAPFTWMFVCGNDNLKLAKRLKRYVSELGKDVSMSLMDLADLSGYPRSNVKKDIRKLMKQDWCPLWLDERTETLYLTNTAYREARGFAAAQDAMKRAAQPQEEPVSPQQQQSEATETALLQSIASFIEVLGKQKQIMQEADAIEEIERMQETCRDIYDWVKTHPESAPRLRRFTSYYMPTTLKLLYSYNDVQGQQGENAETIRRDIGRFLHTLNIAFDNLHDSLLSAVSLDVSAEIAALQGMLAQDGLSRTNDFGTGINLEL